MSERFDAEFDKLMDLDRSFDPSSPRKCDDEEMIRSMISYGQQKMK